jgi:hypothetical protein
MKEIMEALANSDENEQLLRNWKESKRDTGKRDQSLRDSQD